MQSKINHQQKEKAIYEKKENIFKSYIISMQYMQENYTT